MLRLSIQDKLITLRFIVIPSLTSDMIMVVDVITKLRAKMDFGKKIIKMPYIITQVKFYEEKIMFSLKLNKYSADIQAIIQKNKAVFQEGLEKMMVDKVKLNITEHRPF